MVRKLNSKVLLCIAMSVTVVFAFLMIEVLSGQDAYAMGGGGGGGGRNSSSVSKFSVPSAADETVRDGEPKNVPEPGTLLLIGVGLVGVAFSTVRGKIKKR